VAALEEAFAAHPDRIAAVIIEAAPANMGVVPPVDGFNQQVRRITTEHGALMIFDEVLTGFRVGPAGWWGVENGFRPDFTPDLFAFGKVIGGGLPVAAVAGKREIMELLSPLGPVYQAGTLSGNPVAVASGLTTLQLADETVYARIDQVAQTLSSAVDEELSKVGVAHQVQRAGNLFSVFFTDQPVTNYAEAQAQDTFRYPPFFHAMLSAGISLPPSVFEAWFCSAAHDDSVVDQILSALPGAARAAAVPPT
jgi:glutamate-1-semialdehyde 2,1-aminomutase